MKKTHARVLAAVTVGLGTVSGLLGWAAVAVYPWSVYAPVANGQAGAVFGGIALMILAVLFGLIGVVACILTISDIRTVAGRRHAGGAS
jgi:hypothetical protein